jgi:AcrR family transcriptional regulator
VSYHSLIMSTATRQTAQDRRETVLRVARDAFARRGLHGTSTEEIAEAAGISQPYLFRLFGTKKNLFIATLERCLAETLELFRAAAGDARGEDALQAMGEAYLRMLLEDRTRLLLQLQGYASSDDAEVREAMRTGFGTLHLFVETVSGMPPEVVSQWFSKGMLLNVVAAIDVLDSRDPWARRLVDGTVGLEKVQALRDGTR